MEELHKRIEQLENQVEALEKRLQKLEKPSLFSNPMKRSEVKRTPIHEVVKESSVVNEQAEPIVPSKPVKASIPFEQMVMRLLPKVFILILVLGILWALKVASDYGYFNDTMKIVAGFAVSLILLAIALWMEKKQKGSPQIALMLYGGAFIVGILTIAAGAVLYEIIPLTVALLAALAYIAYGIWVSYVKGAQSLTILVATTSFLLPYLLEYMKFDATIIIAYIVVLFSALQLVIWKYRQWMALYSASALSLIAIAILAANDGMSALIYPLAMMLIMSVLLMALIRLLLPTSKQLAHASILFSIITFTILTMNIIVYENNEAMISFILLSIILLAGAYILYKKERKPMVDTLLASQLLVITSIILHATSNDEIQRLWLVLSIAVGLLLGVRLRAPFMQIVYSIAFFIISIILITEGRIAPFWSIHHANYWLIVITLILLYKWLPTTIEQPTKWEQLRQRLYVKPLLSVVIYVVVLVYTMHVQQFFPYVSKPYIALLYIALTLFVLLFLVKSEAYRFVTVASCIAFCIALISISLTTGFATQEAAIGLLVRLVYVGVLLFLVVDFFKQGEVYNKAPKVRQDSVWIIGLSFIVFALFGTVHFLYTADWLTSNANVITNTLIIFIASTISLIVGGRLQIKQIRVYGFILLFIGMIKLIFFDLSALDLFIRAILFIVIGGAGLIMTNQLLRKKT